LEGSSKKKRQSFVLFLRLCVVAGACYFIFKNLDYREFASSFGQLDGWVIALAVAVKFISEGGMALRWWILLRALGISIGFGTAVRLHFHGLFFSSFLPSSTGGDFIRAWYVTRHTEKRALSALSVFADRFTGLFSTALIAAGCFLAFFRGHPLFSAEGQPEQETVGHSAAVIYFVLVPLAAAAVLLMWGGTNRGRFSQFVLFVRNRTARFIQHTREIISVYFRNSWLFPLSVLLTVFFQGLTLFSFWMIGMNLGVSEEWQYYFLFFPLVWVIGVLPVSVAGLGIIEGGVVLLFVKAAGASAESAAALAVCQRVLFLVGALPGMFVHIKADYLPRRQEHIFIDGRE
jgi:hypothetical protein